MRQEVQSSTDQSESVYDEKWESPGQTGPAATTSAAARKRRTKGRAGEAGSDERRRVQFTDVRTNPSTIHGPAAREIDPERAIFHALACIRRARYYFYRAMLYAVARHQPSAGVHTRVL